jgi:hypothetical protein
MWSIANFFLTGSYLFWYSFLFVKSRILYLSSVISFEILFIKNAHVVIKSILKLLSNVIKTPFSTFSTTFIMKHVTFSLQLFHFFLHKNFGRGIDRREFLNFDTYWFLWFRFTTLPNYKILSLIWYDFLYGCTLSTDSFGLNYRIWLKK